MNKKIIIVTGASRGIGRKIAKLLAESEYIVVANYNNSYYEALSLQKELKKENINIDIFKADISKREAVKQLVEFTINKYGTIDGLINNAGIDQEKLFQDITDEDFYNVINGNLYSVFCISQEVCKYMIQNKYGCIINISSIYGTQGGSCAAMYSASKSGIDGLTKSLALELGPSNIRVNSIAPGIINTDMNNWLNKDELEDIQAQIPLGRIGKGIDIAKCVKWLIEDEYTTGQVISINGGWRM